jgi:hypothetical protein
VTAEEKEGGDRTRPGSPATLDLGVSAEPGKRRAFVSHGPGSRTGQPRKHAVLHPRSAAELRGHPNKHTLRSPPDHPCTNQCLVAYGVGV